MDLTPSNQASQFRQRVRHFLELSLPVGWKGPVGMTVDERQAFERQWRQQLYQTGLLAVTWPPEYGGAGLGKVEQFILAEELALARVPAGVPNDLLGIGMLGGTLLAWGSHEQKAALLPRILSGQDRWCEGFSEPNAGSDLASLACRAVLTNDQWVINGQKVWTSYAHGATHIFLLARTSTDGPSHRGITFLLVPMDQPGIEIRPLRNIGGHDEFSEVFFDDARCAVDEVVGAVNEGWRVAMTLLEHERGNLVVTNYAQHRAELDRLVELARYVGRAEDPAIRGHLAGFHARVEIMKYQGLQALTAHSQGRPIGAESAYYKLFATEYHQAAASLALELLGTAGTVIDGPGPLSVFGPDPAGELGRSGSWVGTLYNAVAGTIYAGTSEVQRTIMGERLLGLPKEPVADFIRPDG